MKTLYRLLVSQLVKDIGLFIAVSLVALVLGQQFWKDGSEMFTLVILAAGIMHVMGVSRIAKNQNWLLSLPLKRAKIIFLHYLVATTSFTLYTFSTLLVLFLSGFFPNGGNPTFSPQNFVRVFQNIFSTEHGLQALQILKTTSIDGWGLVILVFGLFNLFFMGPYNPPKTRKAMAHLWNHSNARWRLVYRLFILGLSTFLFFGAFSLTSDIEILIACSTGFIFGAALLASHSVAMPNRSQKRFLTAYGFLALAPIALIYTIAAQRLAKTDPSGKPTKEQVEAYLFLGSLGPKPTPEVLAEVLEQSASFEEFSRTLKSMGIERIRKDTHPQIQYSRVLNSKKYPHRTFELISQYFDVRDLNLLDAKATLNYFEGSHQYAKAFYWLIPANLTTAEISSLLLSGIPTYIQYALIKSRFERKPELISLIESNLDGLPDKLKISALQTLTFLTGRSTNFTSWMEQRAGRAPASIFPSPDCLGYNPHSAKQWTQEEITTLNLCLRERAYSKGSQTIQEVDQAGWLAPPFSQPTQKLIRAVFKH